MFDASGKVVGVAAATDPEGAGNFVIPVARLVTFLETPVVDFDPYHPRRGPAQPVEWTIRGSAADADEQAPRGLVGRPHCHLRGRSRATHHPAQQAGDGVFRAKFIPVPEEPIRWVNLVFREREVRGFKVCDSLLVKDESVTVGDKKFLWSDVKTIFPGPMPRVLTVVGESVNGRVAGLGNLRGKLGQTWKTVDLNEEPKITVSPRAAIACLLSRVGGRDQTRVERIEGASSVDWRIAARMVPNLLPAAIAE